MTKLRIAALVSGSGSNLQSILDAIRDGSLNAEIVQVIASRPGIAAEQRAASYQLPYCVVSRREHGGDTASMGRALEAILQPLAVDLILLCGYLSFLDEAFIRRYEGRIMNIHPSLLPAFGGKGAYGAKVHQAVLDYGAKISGCTVMFVDAGEDTGPIILQKAVPVCEGDTVETLASRVMEQEQLAYPEAVRLFAEHRLRMEGRTVRVLPAAERC